MNSKPLSTRTCFLLILAFGLAAYSNTFAVPFHFDDSINILQNRFLYPLDLGRLWHDNPLRFIANLSFAFNIYLAGFATWSFHILNLLVHILASFVVFNLTRLILNTPAVKDRVPASQQDLFALAVALLFTTHPLQTGAVTYIVQRLTSLAALFYLATLWMYLKTRLEGTRRYGRVFLLMLAAMLTKEISFTLPFLILLMEFYFFPVSENETLRKKITRWIPFAAFLLIIPLLYLMDGYLLGRAGGSINILPSLADKISRWNYLLTQFRVERTYLRLFFFPVDQRIIYDYRLSPGWGDIDSWAAFSLLLGIFLLALAFFKKNRLLSFGVLWFFLTLSVESSVIPLPGLIFEHRLYLPMFGFAFFLTSFLWMISRSVKIFTALSLVIILIFSGMTYSRNEVWKSGITLWQDAARKSPRLGIVYAGLADAYAKETGDFKTAAGCYEKALKSGFVSRSLYANLAGIYSFLGEKEKSLRCKKMFFSAPGSFKDLSAYIDLPFISSMKKERDSKSVAMLNEAVKINPESPLPYIRLGEVYSKMRERENAVLSFRKAIEVAPLYKEGYDALALFYQKSGEKQKAVDVMVEYLRFKKKHKPLFGN